MSKRQWQAVIITASDGSIHYFIGPATFVKDTTLTIGDIQFTEPQDMPDGWHWGKWTQKSKWVCDAD